MSPIDTTEAKKDQELPKDADGRVLFWSEAKHLKLSGLSPEEKDGSGKITKNEQPVEFHDHVLVTKDKKAIKIIMSSLTFRQGKIKVCKDVKDAQEMTMAHDALRQGVVAHHGRIDQVENKDASFNRDIRKGGAQA